MFVVKMGKRIRRYFDTGPLLWESRARLSSAIFHRRGRLCHVLKRLLNGLLSDRHDLLLHLLPIASPKPL
jgi:hypothetical protein